MGEGKPSSTPGTSETYDGSATETHGANTNLDPNMQGGPSTAADRSATEEVVHQNSEQGVPTGLDQVPDPAKQMDNSGMLRPSGEGDGADIIGASGDSRNEG